MSLIFALSTDKIKKLYSLASDESRPRFLDRQRLTLGHLRQGCPIHQTSHIIPGIVKNSAESADRFLRTSLIPRDGHTINRCQYSIEIPNHFAQSDFRWVSRQKIPTTNTRRAIHPALGLQCQHDLLQEALGNIIPAGQFTNGNRCPTVVFYQGKQHPQRVISLFGNSHL